MTTTFTKKKGEIPHFPIIMLGITIIFTIASLIWIGFVNYDTSKVLENAVLKEFRALELRGLILDDDEILTKYIQIAAASSDAKWEKAYDALLPELTSLINEASLLNPSTSVTMSQSDIANQQLILIERQAFYLIKEGKRDEAKALLAGSEYLTQKKIFHNALINYGTTIESLAKDKLQAKYISVRYSVGLILANIIFLILAWAYTLKNILSWKRELEHILVAEMQYKKEIENARHFLHEMAAINKMNDRLQTCQELNEAYSVINITVQQLFPDLSGGLCMRQKATNEMETVQRWGNNQILKTVFHLDNCWALREGHVYIVNDTTQNLVCQHFDVPPTASYICLPLIDQDGVIGMIELNTVPGGLISDYQQQLAITFSEVLRLSIGNIKLRETLNEQAAHDPLTGLFNRRYLNETLPRELKHAIRAKESLCVAMLDLDFFKKINDAYGHEAGDEVLKFVGDQLKASLRMSDIACRFGGEEFLLVMAGTTIQEAMPRLQQICNEIKNAHLHYMKQTLPQITISIGVAEAPTNAVSAVDIIRMADEALYKAKQTGRDKIEIFVDA